MKMLFLHYKQVTVMGIPQIRELLHEYINQADERFIQLVYGMVKADKSTEVLLNDSEHKELDKRIARHKKGESKSYSWKEAKGRLRG